MVVKKVCNCCGKCHDSLGWLLLPYMGLQCFDEVVLELRNCDGTMEGGEECGSTLCIDITEEIKNGTRIPEPPVSFFLN